MNLDLYSLPEDQSLSKQQALCLISQIEDRYKVQEEKYQAQIDYLEEQLRLLRNELFGRKSEKRPLPDHNQLSLFAQSSPVPIAAPAAEDRVIIAEHHRKKRGRKPLPEDLPRVEIIHDLTEEEKQCACGAQLSRIGEDTCEKLDYIPAQVRVLRHIRYKYACKRCEGVDSDGPTVKIAPAPVQLIPKSIVTEGLLAHLVVSKFADALPLYRQQKIFSRLGVEISRATMANWLVQAAQQCSPLMDLLQNEIRSGPLINVDESPFQVLNEPGRCNTTKSYMWVFRGGLLDRPALLYQYHPSRSGQVALDFLDGYAGYVQSDAFSGYERLKQKDGICQVGCWAHARRKFVEVVKATKKHRSKRVNPKSLADDALDYIGQLYQIEKEARLGDLEHDQIHWLRQQRAKPILQQFKQWLDAKEPITPPKGLLGKAIHYALDNWEKLIVYIEDGRLKPDNNAAENAIRPFVLGRKNWLFAGHPNGAQASATFFSLIETAKANDLEPYAYLRYLFEKLPVAEKEEDYRSLLPQYFDRSAIYHD
jgi:transposase